MHQRRLFVTASILALGLALLAGLVVRGSGPDGVQAAPEGKVTVCHSTGSSSNPWVQISINGNAWSAHQSHGDFIVGSGRTCPPAGTATPTVTATPPPTTVTIMKECASPDTATEFTINVSGPGLDQDVTLNCG